MVLTTQKVDMKFFILLSSLSFSVNSLAQEELVEVGKHANVNLDSFSMITSLLMVLMLIVVSAWVLKKFNFVNKSVAGMRVISSLALGHKEKLVVVQVGEEQLLLAVTSQQVSLIKPLATPLKIGEPISQDLAQTVNRFFAKPTKTDLSNNSIANSNLTKEK